MTNIADASPPVRSAASTGLRLDLFAAGLIFIILLIMPIELAEGRTVRATLQVVLFLLVLLITPQFARRSIVFWSPVVCYALFATVSTLWSIAPDFTVKYGLQLAITALMGVHFARCMGPTRFIAVLYAATFAYCILSILSGRLGASAVGPVLIGLAGSKNQFALFAQLLLLTGVTIIMDRTQPTLLRFSFIVSAPISALIILNANSAGAMLTTIVGLLVFLMLLTLQHFGRRARVALVAIAALACVPIGPLTPEIQRAAAEITHTVLKKDPTLTGRTLLWARADALIQDRPLLGYGYSAVWMDDTTLGLGLRRLAGQQEGRGFHFHNTIKQVTVDTGWVGLLIYAATAIIIFLGIAWRTLISPTPPVIFFMTFMLIIVSRSFAELVHGPFSMLYLITAATAVIGFKGVVKRPAAEPRYAALAPTGPLVAALRLPAPLR